MDKSVTFYELNSKNRITATGIGKKKGETEREGVLLSKWLTSVSLSGLLAHELVRHRGQLCMALNSTGVLKLQAPWFAFSWEGLITLPFTLQRAIDIFTVKAKTPIFLIIW